MTRNPAFRVRARYYDPATAQFLTLDPKVAITLSPYGYVAGDPLNETDVLGLGINLPFGLCLRNPFGGDNNNGGCHTLLSTSQGEKALAVTGAVAAVVVTAGLAAPEEGGAAASSMAGAAAPRWAIAMAIIATGYVLYQALNWPNQAVDEVPEGPPAGGLHLSPTTRPTPFPVPSPSPTPCPSPSPYGPIP
jgi:uncharacterized protein RhaS with RHS repeats